MTPSLIYGEAKQVAIQKALNAFGVLSAEDKAGMFELFKVLPLGLDAAGREQVIKGKRSSANPYKDSTPVTKLTPEQLALYKRAAGFFSVLDECKAAGISGAELLGHLTYQLKVPNWHPF